MKIKIFAILILLLFFDICFALPLNAFTKENNITKDNYPPHANDDKYKFFGHETSWQLDILRNDLDLDGDKLTIISITQPANGTAEVKENYVIYSPNEVGDSVEDTFTYTISDGNGGTDTANVYIKINIDDPAKIIRASILGSINLHPDPNYPEWVVYFYVKAKDPDWWNVGYDIYAPEASGLKHKITLLRINGCPHIFSLHFDHDGIYTVELSCVDHGPQLLSYRSNTISLTFELKSK